MSKARLFAAGTILSGLIALPVAMIPASAASADTTSSATTDSGGPLLTVCVTVTPKFVSVGVNGDDITLGPIGVPRTCTGTPF